MAERVLTYTSIEQLNAGDSIFLQEYADVIHITATATLRKGLVKSNRNKRWIDAPIIAFGQMVKYIGNDWFRTDTLLKQSIALTHAYEQQARNPKNAKLFAAFDKNQQNVLLTLRALIEADVNYQDVLSVAKQHALSEEEQMFMRLWQAFQTNSNVLKYNKWFKDFQNQDNTASMMEKLLERTLSDVYTSKSKRKGSNAVPLLLNQQRVQEIEKEFGHDPKIVQQKISQEKAKELVAHTFKTRKVLVFHGFYFITPVQQRLFEALKQSGIEVVHVIHYDDRYPQIFDTVDKFLPMQYAEPMSAYAPQINTMAIRFAKVMEGDFERWPDVLSDEYIVFQQLYQFKDYVLNEDNATDHVISSRASSMEKYLTGLTTASTAELKDYPIGQFLIDIHRLNATTYSVVQKQYNHIENIDSQLLLRIFNSGYLFIPLDNGQTIQGKTLVKDLMKLQKRYPNCKTFEQWQEELTQFIAHKEALEFQMTPPDAKLTDNTELYLYPHRNIGYYNISVERMQHILKGITFLQEFYHRIYRNTTLSIKEYIEQMQQFITKQLKPNIAENDKVIADEVLTQIQALDQQEFEGINRKDIIKGLQFFLSRTDRTNDATEKVDDGEDSLYKRAIVPLIDADGLVFEDNRHVHLAFMDNKALPLVQNISLWPLRQETIAHICAIDNGNTLKQLTIRKEVTGSITAYLLYLTMQKATNLKISMVKNVEDEHHLEPSFYLELMRLRQGKKNGVAMDVDQLAPQYKADNIKRLATEPRRGHHILYQTHLACSRRFILSYLLQKRSDFSEDYHHTFLYQGLVQYYNKLANDAKYFPQIRQLIDEMFPQWTTTKRDVLYRDALAFKGTVLVEKPVDQERFHTLLRPASLLGLKTLSAKDEVKYVASDHTCKYCPFKLQCRDSKNDSKNEMED